MLRALGVLVLSGLVACADSAPGEPRSSSPSGGEPDEARVGQVSLALTDTDPVSAAVSTSCTTTSVKGLSTQLVAEIQCMKPGSMTSMQGAAGLSLGSAVFPFLQTPAARALLVAQKARGTTMSINSALRTLPQQYLLYAWYKAGRCGISLAAEPGKSNHEGAVAVDLADAQAWRPAMASAGFRWLGASDPVHFDFTGAATLDLRGLSVTAFQRLWNRNHPEDPIGEDGAYGTETGKRVARAPVGGFPKGAESCAADASDPSADAGTGPVMPVTPEPVPDANEPAVAPEEDSGCALTRSSPFSSSSSTMRGLGFAALVALAVLSRRARADRKSR